MNLGRSWWRAWSQELRVQRATLGSARTKVRKRQVLATEGEGKPRWERSGRPGPLKVRAGAFVCGGVIGPWKARGGRGVQVGKPQDQVSAKLTSCPSVVPLCCTCKAPTQGPQRQSHCGHERSWKLHCPFALLQGGLDSPPSFGANHLLSL